LLTPVRQCPHERGAVHASEQEQQMRKHRLPIGLALALSTAVSVPAFAQSTSSRPAARDEWRAPWQSGFWGYAGINAGRSNYNAGCGGTSCDVDANAGKFYFGGKFNNNVGMEVGYVNMGKADFAGGHLEAHGLNISLVAGVPIGTNSSVFGKIGTTAGRTKVSGTIPAVQTGTDDGWGLSYGIGGQIGLTPQWALRLDADRYRYRFIGIGREDVDTLTVGLQYTFR
jgi:OOP family OmpA-OmpF porin